MCCQSLCVAESDARDGARSRLRHDAKFEVQHSQIGHSVSRLQSPVEQGRGQSTIGTDEGNE